MKAKKFLSVLLVLAICIGMMTPAYAANSLGVTFSAELDQSLINTSAVDQTVEVTLKTNDAITIDGIGGVVSGDSPLVLTSITSCVDTLVMDDSFVNLEQGDFGSNTSDMSNIDIAAGTPLVKAVFTVPAGTAAGTYTVNFTGLNFSKDLGGEEWEDDGTFSATLTVAAVSGTGYTAGVTKRDDVSVDETVYVDVLVQHASEVVFAAGEITLTYDKTLLSFDQSKSTLPANAVVKNSAGTLTLADYGADKNFGSAVYTLAFTAIADGEAVVSVTAAAFSNKENAAKRDLIAVDVISPESTSVTVSKKVFDVTLPDIFVGDPTVTDGESYTFTVADGDNYDYDEVTATVDGATVTVIDNGNGSYTVENVTGKLVINGTRTEKAYGVTFEGNAAEDITDGADTATYNTDYTFTMPAADGWAYSLESITIGDEAYTGYTVADSVYTIPGADIKGEIVITVSKSQTVASVTVEGSGAGAAAGYEAEATIGEEYTLTITPEAGYSYEVTATMNGSDVEVTDNGDNTYTIADVQGNIVFNVEAIVIVDNVSVQEYVTVDGSKIWLVLQDTALAEGKAATYDGSTMFWSEKYGAYCYLVVSDTLDVDSAKELIGIATANATAVDYGMDVNITGKVDANDAQLVYNMYMAVYDGFTDDATMEKFLRADINYDKSINVSDATAIVNGGSNNDSSGGAQLEDPQDPTWGEL